MMSHREDVSFTTLTPRDTSQKCEMLVSLVLGGSLPPVALCQVSHKLASTRDTRVMPREGGKNYERMKEKKRNRQERKSERKREAPLHAVTRLWRIYSNTIRKKDFIIRSFTFRVEFICLSRDCQKWTPEERIFLVFFYCRFYLFHYAQRLQIYRRFFSSTSR